MELTHKIDEQITVGGQPAPEDFPQLKEEGFRSIVNFRNDDEDENSMSPQSEAEWAAAHGMAYLQVPVTMKAMARERVDQFRQEYPNLPKPIFAHCKSGKRAAAMALMNLAVEKGMTGAETLQEADHLGIELGQPELEAFIKSYVDSHFRDA
jgi:uncharacterized protein (TIGR01244 family)